MKAVILAGGLGTRLSEETQARPKPMVEIGGRPILWHIMKIYEAHGITDFIICLGYKGYLIKEYFANYLLHTSDVTFDLARNRVELHANKAEPFRVTLVDTGDQTMTGGRLRRVAHHLEPGEDFCFTYGDGVGDIDIRQSVAFHKAHGLAATMTGTRQPGRWGTPIVDGDRVQSFQEKPQLESSYINGGFFVLSPRALQTIDGDDTMWEREPMERLAKDGQLAIFKHEGFWQPMDTLREKHLLEDLWTTGRAPWKVWQ